MNYSGIADMNPATREAGFEEHSKFLNGTSVEPKFTEGFDRFDGGQPFRKLKANVDTKDGACVDDVANRRKRMELIYAMALYRDAEYAHCGRKFMLSLGNNDVFRGLYEGGKLQHDAENSTADT